MAREFKLLFVLWLVACLAVMPATVATTTKADPTTTTVATTTTADLTTTTLATTTTADPTTTTLATTTTADPTTTTLATTTTAVPTTTTLATTTTADPTTTTVATTTTADPTTTTLATTTTAVPTTTTLATTTTAVPTTTTLATTTTAVPTTTTVATTTTAVPTTTTLATTTTAVPTTTTVATTTTADPTTTTVATTTTADPTTTTVATTTTADPTTTTATADPTTTTVATTTTADPTTTTVATTTTADPTTTTVATTTADPTATTTTADPTATTTTADPTTTTVATTTTPVSTTTKPPENGCALGLCGDGSTCEPRVGLDFVCLCLPGDFYNDVSKSCEKAKVFPGELHLLEEFKEEMKNKASKVFKETAEKVIVKLDAIFNSMAYSGSTVLELNKLDQNSKIWSRTVGASAVVDISFKANANITEYTVINDINAYLNKCTTDCVLGTFQKGDLCSNREVNACDNTTTRCSPTEGSFNCTCMENYIQTDFSTRVCIACPSGQKADGSNTCIDCPFGYSGFNCNESWQLALVIVGSVLGGLLLITLILLPLVSHKSSKKSSKKNKNADFEEPYVSHSTAKTPLVNGSFAKSQVNGSANAFANAGVPRIPRAATTSSLDSRTNLEMMPSNSRHNLGVGRNARLYEDPDDMNQYAQTLPQSNLYAQARPQNNPYSQTRAQINPYASSQGHSNPYYLHDDGRRFN